VIAEVFSDLLPYRAAHVDVSATLTNDSGTPFILQLNRETGDGMSRKAIWLLCFCYLAAAIAFAGFEAWLDPLSGYIPAALVGHVVGGGIGIFAMAAILPMIIWACMRFRGANAGGIFVLWAVVAVVMAYLSHVGNATDREQKIAAMTPNGVFAGKDRVDFLRSAKLSCAQKQRENPLTAKIGLSEQKIVAYCDCIAEGLAEAITVDELRTAVTTGKQAASFLDKTTMMGNFCSQQVLYPK
jgi:uncharacterized membrane protein YhaH (DUF805 family)